MSCTGVPRILATHTRRKRNSSRAFTPLMNDSTSENNEMSCMMAPNEPVTKYSARLMRKQMLAAGGLNKADREYLKHMIEHGELLDGESFYILLNLLLTAPHQ